MVLPRPPHIDARTTQFVRDEMLRSFEEETPPIEVSEADLVSVVIDARFRVHAISLYGTKLGTEEAAKVEQALVAAFNRAVGEVVRRSADRLALALDQAGSYAGPDD